MASISNPDFDEGANDFQARLRAKVQMKRSWQDIRDIVRHARKSQSSIASRQPYHFTFRTAYSKNSLTHRLYFLGPPEGCRENTLLYCDLVENGEVIRQPISLKWNQVLDTFQTHSSNLSKEEQLLRERKRLSHFGITSYDVDLESGRFVIPLSSSLFTFVDDSSVPINPSEIKSSTFGPRMDPKLCPYNQDLVAFINNNDLWISNHVIGHEMRLTYAHTDSKNLAENPYSAGVPSFVMQEEFDRYTGYWWQPQYDDNPEVYRILYEYVDESDVDIIHIASSANHGDSFDEYRYPRAGKANSKSSLRIVEFQLNSAGQIKNVLHRQLNHSLSEYLVRIGWTPDGQFVWAQVLDRLQQHLTLLIIPMSSFRPLIDESEMDTHDQNDAQVQIIYEEKSNVWINVDDILHFLPDSRPNVLSFLWLSERTGHKHLYRISVQCMYCNSSMEKSDLPKLAILDEVQITSGDWDVLGSQIWVDEHRSLVYFMGLKDTPLEAHLYVTTFCKPSSIRRLTDEGNFHAVTLDPDCSMFVSIHSSINSTPRGYVYRIHHSENSLIAAEPIGRVLESTITPYRNPTLFEYKSSSGYTHHGMVYKPFNLEPNKKYPTILFVYGGPQVQLVTNAYKGARFLRLHTLSLCGFAVVVVDCRGSINRGLHFEGHIKHCMGSVEIEDQVEGLKFAASQERFNFIDIDRVAIHGWSYGGYLSLLGLAQRPDVFKISIAGAPVTSWDLYDTGYTERYMGLPAENQEGYTKGSVLNYISCFPNEENRLLIVHGLIDENVHFQHTRLLVNALIKNCKPHLLQVYPNERHGIRNSDANEHYETMVISFLQKYL